MAFEEVKPPKSFLEPEASVEHSVIYVSESDDGSSDHSVDLSDSLKKRKVSESPECGSLSAASGNETPPVLGGGPVPTLLSWPTLDFGEEYMPAKPDGLLLKQRREKRALEAEERKRNKALLKKPVFPRNKTSSSKMAVAIGIDTDWRDNKSLSECMLYMLKNEIMCDVTFRVGGERKPIRAHKYMLSSRSTVFYSMLEGSLQEKEVISIPDIEESTFYAFLKYIYSDELSITNDNVKEMLYLSDKYRITRIKKECEKILLESASTHDAAKAFQIAYEYNLTDLLNQSFSHIEKNTTQCLLSAYALDLSKECLELILKSEYLDCTETKLCSFFLKWTLHQCDLAKVEGNGANMRTIAGNLLYLVRFPLVDPKIFTKDISTTDLLSLSETVSIYQYNFGVTAENLPFSNKERTPVAKREILTITRFQEVTSGWQSNCTEALKFETNKDVWLKGVVIGSVSNPYQYQSYNYYNQQNYNSIHFKVISTAGTELYSYTDNVVSSSPQDSLTEIRFPDPLKISKSTKYTITMEGLQDSSYHSTNCLKSVSIGDVTFSFEKSALCTSGTDENQGQFAGLMFSI